VHHRTGVPVSRGLELVWGVTPLLNRSQPTTDELIDGALGAALAAGRAQRGDTIVITAGVPVGRLGMTNLIKVETL
jgi:pyruvate kinase